MAFDHGVSKVVADTAPANAASQRTLVRAGFRLVGTDGDRHSFELHLEGGDAPQPAPVEADGVG